MPNIANGNLNMRLLNKIKWVTGVLLVFVIVLTTNLIDKENFNELKESTTTIYKDRIVASDLIFDISYLIQEQKMAIATVDTAFFEGKSKSVQRKLDTLIARFEHTRLTSKEANTLNALKQDLKSFAELQDGFISNTTRNESETVALVKLIDQHLYDLSKVQLKEGKKQMLKSVQTMKTIDLFTRIEIIFLVIAALLIQVIILYKPKAD